MLSHVFVTVLPGLFRVSADPSAARGYGQILESLLWFGVSSQEFLDMAKTAKPTRARAMPKL